MRNRLRYDFSTFTAVTCLGQEYKEKLSNAQSQRDFLCKKIHFSSK